MTDDERTVCEGCSREIDPTTCHCGDPMDMHSMGSGHSPVPMGCDCGRDTTPCDHAVVMSGKTRDYQRTWCGKCGATL